MFNMEGSNMSEFDDIFKKGDPTVTPSPATSTVTDPEKGFQDTLASIRINRWILLTYVVVSLLVSLFSIAYFRLKWTNSAEYDANLVQVEPLTVGMVDSGDPNYPYRITVNGTVRNGNAVTLPVVYVDFLLYDAEGNLIDEIYLEAVDVEPGEVVIFDQYFDYGIEIFSVSQPIEVAFDESSSFYILLSLASVLICSLVFMVLDKATFVSDWKKFRGSLGGNIGKILIGYVMVYAALYVSQIILELLGVYGTSANEQTIASMFSPDPLNLTLLFLLLCVFTPITEEMVFRKVVFGFFERKWGKTIGIIGSGAIFGLMHVLSYGDLIQSIPYVAMGMVFGYIYHSSQKNLYVVFGVHFLNNFVSFLIYALGAYGISLI
jgi:hypothetical protein